MPKASRDHSTTELQILIADDHAILREGLKQMLREKFPNVAFGEAGSASAAVKLLHQQP